jgi:5-methylthioadenosine/S-adenosylhomocysteine deaminase
VSLLVEHATVLDPAPEGLLVHEDTNVRIDDGRIQAVGSTARGADRVLDADGDLLLPGLVNAHGHAPMTLLRGVAEDRPLQAWLEEAVWPIETHLEPEHVLAGARLACAEMIEHGITAFADMYLFEDAVAQAADETGLACLAGASITDAVTAEGGPEEVLAHARELLDEHPPGEGRVRGSLAPHAVYTCGPDTLERVAAIADDEGARIQTHLAETMSEVYTTEDEHGQRPLAHLDEHGCLREGTILAHGGWMTRAEARRIGDADAVLAHCPTANEKLATGGVAPVPELLDADAGVAFGTDGPASNNRIDVLQEAKRAALLHKHHRWDAEQLPAEQVLAMASRGGAEALGFEQAGRVTEGAWADLALVSTEAAHMQPVHDPVAQVLHAAHAGDVRATIVDGELAYHEGKHVAMDVDAIVDEAEEAAEHLVAAAGDR